MNDENLSSLVDGECSQPQLDRVLRQLREDPKARARLSRYSLAQAVLRGVRVRNPDPGFADRVMAALPANRPQPVVVSLNGRMGWRPLAGLAAAAGVGAVAVLALQPEPVAQPAATVSAQPLAATPPSGSAPLASLEQAQAEQLRNYVMAYSQSRSRQGMGNTLNHARHAAYTIPAEGED
jgi:negative regulator of sigma E activity